MFLESSYTLMNPPLSLNGASSYFFMLVGTSETGGCFLLCLTDGIVEMLSMESAYFLCCDPSNTVVLFDLEAE